MAQAKRAKTTKKSVGRPKGSTNKSKGTRSRKKKNCCFTHCRKEI